MRQFFLLVVATILVGCAAVQIVGPDTDSLSKQDLQQIQSVVAARSDIHFKAILYVHVMCPNRVYVEAADSIIFTLIRSTFTARKHAGQWSIDAHSIQNYDKVFVTE